MRIKSVSKIGCFIITVLALNVLAISTGLAKPPAQEGPGEIAVPIFDGAHYNTWLIDASNGWTTLILNQIRQPAFSFDGQWLIANGTRPDYEHLLLLKADDSEVEEISPYSEDAQSSWSPDGRSIVFSSTRESDRQYRLYVIDDVWEIEVKERVLTYGEGTSSVMGWHPVWLPDGRIVYNGCNAWEDGSKCGLTIIEPEGSIPVQITGERHDLPLDARGDVILMMSYREDEDWEIYTIRTDGTDLRRLTTREGEDGLPTFSPDGQSIAFVRDESGEEDKDKEVWALWAMNADGTNPRKLLDLGAVFGRDEFDWLQEQLSWRPSLSTRLVEPSESPVPPSDISSWTLFLEDDFSDPNSGWVTDESEIRRAGYEEGQYSILIKAKRWVAWDLVGDNFTNFVMEVEATQVAGPGNNEYGVICRHQDTDNFYFFAISGLGHYSVWKQENDVWAVLVRWKKSRNILQGQSTNRLRVVGNGPQMSFYANDQHLVDVYDPSFPEGDLGLAAGAFDEPGVHIRFDNLRVLVP